MNAGKTGFIWLGTRQQLASNVDMSVASATYEAGRPS